MISYARGLWRPNVPTLLARRYLRPVEHVGRTEKVVGLTILGLVVALVAGFIVHVLTAREPLFQADAAAYDAAGAEAGAAAAGAASAQSSERPTATNQLPAANGDALLTTASLPDAFPDPGLEHWSVPARVERFDADNLYIEIDGRAAAYLQRGCVALTVGSYQYRGDAERLIDVYCFDMGTADNALAMYRSERPPDVPPVPVGQAGYQVGGAVFFCQGAWYVQVVPTSPGAADAPAALKIAEAIAARIGR